MAPYLRKVKTTSGAWAVQIVAKKRGVRRIVEHLGSARSEAEVALLYGIGKQKLLAGQGELELGLDIPVPEPIVESSASTLLWEVLENAYLTLGFDTIGDEVFKQLVLARIIEPTSKVDSIRVLTELGINAPHRNTIGNCLKRVNDNNYRDTLAKACFTHSVTTGGVSLILYDVTTLYFEAEKEDALRKVGYSKERRVDPQIVLGLLVDRGGFPLEIHCFEGNKAETLTIIPVLKAFQERHKIVDMVVAADAGMLSAKNLAALEEAGYWFIVGAKIAKAPYDLASHFKTRGTGFEDGQIVETKTVMGQGRGREYRVVYQYSRKRFVRDTHTLALQEARAKAIVEGKTRPKRARFVSMTGARATLNAKDLEKARTLAGLKGYVTNIDARVMSGAEVISSYHDLYQVERSFRMAKTDLRARPFFHHIRESIEAHLTIVFTALAVSRYLQEASGVSIKRLVKTLRPMREVTIEVEGHQFTAKPKMLGEAREILDKFSGH